MKEEWELEEERGWKGDCKGGERIGAGVGGMVGGGGGKGAGGGGW